VLALIQNVINEEITALIEVGYTLRKLKIHDSRSRKPK
jgi:hypothetical protein